MRHNRTDSPLSRHNQGNRRSGQSSVLDNQKVGQRLRQNTATTSDASNPSPRRTGGRRPGSLLLQRPLLRVLHGSFWLVAACGLLLKAMFTWVVELFTGDDVIRQSRHAATVEPFMDEWQDHEQQEEEFLPLEEDLVDSWSEESPETLPPGLRDFESLKIASLEAEEHELSEEALADQAASLRARLERVRNES